VPKKVREEVLRRMWNEESGIGREKNGDEKQQWLDLDDRSI